MILVDTGPLVALFDPADADHKQSGETLETIREPIATTVPVLTEAFHLLGAAGTGVTRLMDFVAGSGLHVLFLDDSRLVRAFQLMAQYADLPMDFADASIVTMAESLNLRTVFTIDRDHFSAYRIKRGHRYMAFTVIG